MDRSLNAAVTAGLERALGRAVELRRVSPLGGGDINDAYLVETDAGASYFVKANSRSPRGMFSAEARGLAWLAEAGALRVPSVVCHSAEGGPQFLALEYLRSSARRPDFAERLGRGLAALHRFDAAQGRSEPFGLDHDNFIGSLPQSNAERPTWHELYRDCRLEPQVRLARERGLFSGGAVARFERLFSELAELCGPAEPPSRVHGDLWGGNLHVDERGEPALIDPAVYRGHREVDLAMMRLFGGFEPAVFDAYDEAFALAPGHESRVELYQLYPILVHVNLFGGSYVRSAERVLGRYT